MIISESYETRYIKKLCMEEYGYVSFVFFVRKNEEKRNNIFNYQFLLVIHWKKQKILNLENKNKFKKLFIIIVLKNRNQT